MKQRKDFGNYRANIKAIRHSHQFSVPELAKKLNLPHKRWQEVERGRLNPSPKEMAAIEKFSGYPLDTIIHHTLTLEVVVKP